MQKMNVISQKRYKKIFKTLLLCLLIVVLLIGVKESVGLFCPNNGEKTYMRIYFSIISYPFNDYFIHQKALELSGNLTDETEISITIADWVSKNVNLSNSWSCKKCFTDSETLLKRCGACGEKANLIESLLNSIGINAVSVGTTGEDHEWNYIFVDGNPVFIDASGDGGILNYGMPLRDFERTYNRNVSFVAIYYANGSVVEVTKDYTDTSLLNVSVLNRYGNPVKNAAIIIRSHSLIESHMSNETFESTHCFTGDSGYCYFSLGDGKYTVQAASTFLGYLMDEENVSLSSNSNMTYVVLHSDFEADSLLSIFMLAIFTLIILVIRFTTIFLNSSRKKRKGF